VMVVLFADSKRGYTVERGEIFQASLGVGQRTKVRAFRDTGLLAPKRALLVVSRMKFLFS